MTLREEIHKILVDHAVHEFMNGMLTDEETSDSMYNLTSDLENLFEEKNLLYKHVIQSSKIEG